jgi:hypothetical protein
MYDTINRDNVLPALTRYETLVLERLKVGIALVDHLCHEMSSSEKLFMHVEILETSLSSYPRWGQDAIRIETIEAGRFHRPNGPLLNRRTRPCPFCALDGLGVSTGFVPASGDRRSA